MRKKSLKAEAEAFREQRQLGYDPDARPNGFEGGMSTRKYEGIAGTSRATASRELIELEAHGLLVRIGAGRSTRYYVSLPSGGPVEPA